ncbi:MAG: response regulator transcription factor [Spirochaetaceae bacterium]|nr:response regulator transcription factor [Spirochaetaceae bacterium]
MLRIAIVEDNAVAASILVEYISCDDIAVDAVYRSGEEALERMRTLPLPDVLLLDLNLPGISGIETAERIKAEWPSVEIVMQTVFEDSESIFKAIRAGVSGYLLKASTSDEFRKAIREAKAGGSPLSSKVAKRVLESFRAEATGGTARKGGAVERFDLTEREEQILAGLIRGASYKGIAAMLNISPHTVNSHIRKVYEKLRVTSRSAAVARALGQ